MRALLSKFFLVAFIFVFAVPSPLLAQNTWTPPTQPAVGGNTPSPINVSQYGQTKRGVLTVDGEGANTTQPGFTSRTSSQLRGTSVFDVSNMPGAIGGLDMIVSWVKANFMNNVTVGNQGTVGPEIKLNGQLYYKPLESNGALSANQPAANKVLKAVDANGKLTWGTAIPDGTNGGDTLIWDSICNCWVTGPSGTSTISGLPNGTQGQTLWYNNNTWQATDQIKHDNFAPPLNWTRTTLNNEVTDIKGTQAVYVGSVASGTTQIGSPQVKIIGNDTISIGNQSNGDTFLEAASVKFGNTQPAADWQTVDVTSGNVNFASPDDGGYQTVTFESDAVKLKNINMNPGTGRIPYSRDDEGQFGWNENFTYQLNQGGLFPEPVGQLSLSNPQGGVAVFQNQGISHLLDDVYIDDTGDLYLYGIESAAANQRGVGLVQHLCYITTTKKVVTCYDDPITEAPTQYELEPVYDTDYEILRTADHNTGPLSTYVFQSNQTVDIKFCGGGGQGGGGGMGSINHGGGGGGGGAAGSCQTLNALPVSVGDQLSWQIGPGGAGSGLGTRKQDNPNCSGPSCDYEVIGTAGNAGQSTSLFIDYISDSLGNPVQLGQTQSGGAGGQRGIGQLLATPNGPNISTITGGYIGGDGANSALANWHDGAPGCSQINIANCTYNPANWNSGGNGANGGSGGDGQNAMNSNLGSAAAGSGGNPGTAYISDNCVEGNICFQIGGPGYIGELGFGGGGGAGGAGMDPIELNGDVMRWPGGGNGGAGGSGYVRVSGILNSVGGTNAVTFDAPSSTDISYPVSAIPVGVANVTLEVWSGGGGGGGVKTGPLADRTGGGGGGGGYIKIPNVPRSQLGATLSIKVGTGGVAGISSGTTGSVTNGGQGGTSYIKVSGSTIPLLSVSGGLGGSKDNDNDSANAPGGAGGQPSTTGSPISGLPNQVLVGGSNGGTNGGGSNPQGTNNGGIGADTNFLGALGTASGAGQNGKVKISW